MVELTGEHLTLRCLDSAVATLLNPETVQTVIHDGGETDPAEFRLPLLDHTPKGGYFGAEVAGGPETWDVVWDFGEVMWEMAQGTDVDGFTLALLWEPAEDEEPLDSCPVVTATVDGKPAELTREEQAGRWSWHTLEMDRNPLQVEFHLAPAEDGGPVTGKVMSCMHFGYRPEGRDITLVLKEPVANRPMPPSPRPAGELRWWANLGWQELR